MSHRILFAAACILLTTSLARAGDWSQWRGPEQNGVSRERGLPDKWSPDGLNIVWKSPIGGRSTPIIMNGRIYLNCRTLDDPNEPSQKIHIRDQVVCREADTGKVLWIDALPPFGTDIPAPRIGWAAMAGDPETGLVYVHNVSAVLRCYDADGKVVWERSLGEEFGEITGYGGRIHTPIIDEDRLIVSGVMASWGDLKPPPKHLYLALDKRTGEILWTGAPGGRPTDTTYSCPVVAVVNGTRMLIGGNADGGVWAMKARTGEPIWGIPMSKRGVLASVVYDDGLVFASHGEDNVDSIEFGRVQCIDAATGKGVWRVDGLKAGYSTGTVFDGVLYIVSDLGKLHAFDTKTGKELWVHHLGTVGKGSPVYADGKLYVMEVNGRVHILKPTREKCETLSTVEITSNDASGYDEIYASPAIANGKVYLVTRDATYCIGLKDARPTPDPIPPMPPEKPVGSKVAKLILSPYSTDLKAGESVKYTLGAYDDNGRFIRNVEGTLTVAGLPGAAVDGALVKTGTGPLPTAGSVTAKFEELTASARIRAFPPLPWKYDFEAFKEKAVPAPWVTAFLKLLPTPVDGNVAMKNPFPPTGKPSGIIFMGPPTMKGYTVQCDLRGARPAGKRGRQMPDIGIVNQRYTLALLGNSQSLQIESWVPHERMGAKVPFAWKLDNWYTAKLRVDMKDGSAEIKGKVWAKGTPEPAEWTITATDPHPQPNGSPGLYYYALADSYYDNVIITESEGP